MYRENSERCYFRARFIASAVIQAFPAASSLLRLLLLLLLRNFSPSRVNDSRLPEQPAGLPRISEMDLASITRERNMISGESARSLVNSRARPIHACVYGSCIYDSSIRKASRVCRVPARDARVQRAATKRGHDVTRHRDDTRDARVCVSPSPRRLYSPRRLRAATYSRRSTLYSSIRAARTFQVYLLKSKFSTPFAA